MRIHFCKFKKYIFQAAKGKVTGIEMFHKILEEANAGDQMGLLARGLKQTDVRRGMCVVKLKSVNQRDSSRTQVSATYLHCTLVQFSMLCLCSPYSLKYRSLIARLC